VTSRLFSPIALRGLTLPNRIVVSPMCQYSAVDGTVGDWHIMHLGQFAVGGAGLVMVEASGVEAAGRISPGCVGLYSDENEAALARVVRFCREHSKAKVAIQLAHAGRKASVDLPWNGGASLTPDKGAWQTYGPSALHVATDTDREQVVVRFVGVPRLGRVDEALHASEPGADAPHDRHDRAEELPCRRARRLSRNRLRDRE